LIFLVSHTEPFTAALLTALLFVLHIEFHRAFGIILVSDLLLRVELPHAVPLIIFFRFVKQLALTETSQRIVSAKTYCPGALSRLLSQALVVGCEVRLRRFVVFVSVLVSLDRLLQGIQVRINIITVVLTIYHLSIVTVFVAFNRGWVAALFLFLLESGVVSLHRGGKFVIFDGFVQLGDLIVTFWAFGVQFFELELLHLIPTHNLSGCIGGSTLRRHL
jgi:hypothetical protein